MSVTLSQEGLRGLRMNANVLAFLRVIREKESSQDESAYTILNGGSHFFDTSRHPYEGVPTTKGGKAAGAYQFLGTTWARLVDLYSFPDFGPESQDLGAIALIQGRGALADVIAGRFDSAVAKLRPEWTSLPGAAESRADWTLAKAREVFVRWGGTFAPVETPALDTQPAAPIEDHSPALEKTTVDPLSAIALFGPLISQLIPQVAKLFDKKAESPAKLEAAQKVIDTIVASTATPNAQAAVEKMTADPVALKAATSAVVTQPDIMQLLEVGGGIERARAQVVEMAALPPQRNVALIVAGFLTPLLYIVVIAVTFDLGGTWSDEMRSVVVTAIVTGLLGSITGFFLGSSYGSSRKTDMLNEVKNG